MIQRQGPSPLYYETSPHNPPTLWVDPGEPFEVASHMSRGPDLQVVPSDLREEWLRHEPYAVERGNPSSGAVWVRGAEPGMAVEVSIEALELAPVGYTMFAGDNLLFPRTPVTTSNLPTARVVPIRDGHVIWDERLAIPVQPMVGMVGVAPAHEAQSNLRVGEWGGNMDVQEVAPGAKVRLVVNVPGALLHIGDVHALQGDGEIGGSAIETSGVIRLRAELMDRPEEMTWPRIVTPARIMTVASGRPAERALRIAAGELIRWLHADYGIEPEEALLLLSQVLEARATQVVNPTITYVAGIRREILRKL
ncbi:MAG: acetamidase/formamidase family protein [bacterium]|nr:acetamidase/formamidase family protein [bacterium]MDE0502062.1 acetamidase/formamidase family protein [bacterium]